MQLLLPICARLEGDVMSLVFNHFFMANITMAKFLLFFIEEKVKCVCFCCEMFSLITTDLMV